MSAGKGRTVLVVDDEPDIRKTVKRLLEGGGYAVWTATSGEEAVEILAGERSFDLVVLDVTMPGIDGYVTLDRMRRSGFENLPVVMLTARTEERDVMKGYRVGADYYLTKPFRNELLVNIVDYLVGDLPPEERTRLERSL